MKRIILWAILIGIVMIVYSLFQNIFDWNFGWKKIPQWVFETQFVGIQDSVWVDEINRASGALADIQRRSQSPAVSIAVSIDGKLVWSEARGFRDIENRLAADTNTLFRIGSTSKALTSLGLGKLMEGEKIHPDSSIQYYTGLFSSKPVISISQLAGHQSGIRNYGLCLCFPVWEYFNQKQFKSIEESIEVFEDDDLLFEPGQGFSYTTYNYTALSAAMESASKVDFLEFMENEVFKPLEMRHTQGDHAIEEIENRSRFYEISKWEFKESFYVNNSNKWAGGGFISRPTDLVKAGNVLLDSVFLLSNTIKELITPLTMSDGSKNPNGYAMGWRNQQSQELQTRIIHHGGVSVGSQSLLVVIPEFRISISLLINRGKGEKFELLDYVNEVASIFINRLTQQ